MALKAQRIQAVAARKKPIVSMTLAFCSADQVLSMLIYSIIDTIANIMLSTIHLIVVVIMFDLLFLE
jgi:hypothetical protein